MRRTSHTPILLAALALTLAACAAGQGASGSASPSEAPEASVPVFTPRDLRTAPPSASPPPSDGPVTGDVPASILDPLIADAADRTGVDPDAIEVVEAQEVTWNDGSLGCPEPGMSYTMALVDGYHVILAAEDTELDYRATGEGTFKLCENPPLSR
jgi:hypothetical protein